MKRLVDLACSLAALLVLSPLFIPVMIILRCTGEGEIFYRQERIGLGGKPFGLYKFATMLKDSPNLGKGLFTTEGDPRILPFGRFLRATKINELPQLLNIAIGDMSIIGPRPLVPSQFAMYAPEVRADLSRVRPGLSGIGSIVFRDEEAILTKSPKGYLRCFKEDITPYKGALEQWYIERQTVFLDLLLIALTVAAVLAPSSNLFQKILKDLPDPPSELKCLLATE
ncbi:glycosyl transferase [Geomonas limicola]|uniref:Glycosyl transferase n=1 Tax=Geomonas limicola TaxID=2740186 RepID=A0A6V8N9L7_9BACT|nr:sugar transferase [Geomonas limicola]GFO69231.1 glycosyl transferase [Geomonas limicola]